MLAGLRAAGEETRLRLLYVLARGEFNVSELTTILGQSQPRVSRHLKLMVEAGLVQRFREGAWMLFSLQSEGPGADLARALNGFVDKNDPQLLRDLEKIAQVKAQRQSEAQAYFAKNAGNWNAIRALHVEEEKVEATVLELAGQERIGRFVDLGTGTGRMLELLAPLADEALGFDLSREMLSLARSELGKAGLDDVHVRQGDITDLPVDTGSTDLALLHQVLHFLDDPGAAIAEAVRILKPDGRLIVVDFAPHSLEFMCEKFHHRRQGVSHYEMKAWAEAAGGKIISHEQLAAPAHMLQQGLSVVFWVVGKR